MSNADKKMDNKECQSSSNSYCMDQCLVTGAWTQTTCTIPGDGLEGVFHVPSFLCCGVSGPFNVRFARPGLSSTKAQDV